MLRGVSVPAVSAIAVAGLLTGCTSFPGATSSTSVDTSGATCTDSGGAGSKITPPSGGLSGIVVHGSCSVVGLPDTATLLINVETQGPTARAATDSANGRADAVINALKGKGLQQNDVRAGQLLVNPVISPIITSPITGVGGTRITAFDASRLITATVRSIGQAATITSSVLDAAGDSARVQLNYSISDDTNLRAQARAAAIKQANEKAKSMADAAGISLGQIISITDAQPNPPSFAPTAPEVSSAAAGTANTQQVQSDGQLLQAAVDVVYAVG